MGRRGGRLALVYKMIAPILILSYIKYMRKEYNLKNKKSKNANCLICGVLFSFFTSNRGGKYCSRKCYSKVIHKNFGDTSGSNNSAWKGGGDRNKRYKESHPEIEKFNGTKARSKLLNIPNTLTLNYFRDWYNLTPKICAYCDKNISIKTTKRMNNLSIDRKSNEQGYVEGNICFSCNRCNTVKGNTFNYEQMREIAQKYLKQPVTSI